ncbi:hypothetical protein BH20ACT17_BH20ACT17_04210 [soil metagenome]
MGQRGDLAAFVRIDALELGGRHRHRTAPQEDEPVLARRLAVAHRHDLEGAAPVSRSHHGE